MFGAVLTTDRPLPGLPVAPTGDGHSSFWELRTTDSDMPRVGHTGDVVVQGRQAYASGMQVTLASGAAGDEIAITDTGRFSLGLSAPHIVHVAPPQVDRSAVALDLIGVVLPFLLHRDGAWCVHASAVQTPAGVIAFLAPRGTGKSTIASACLQHGCALVADDVVVLRPDGHGLSVVPAGLPLRLRIDTARALGATVHGAEDWGKVRVDASLATAPAPLAAIYLLSPAAADATVAREPRTARAAALALMAHGKITELLGGAGAGEALTRCIDVAARIRVFDLAVPRDLARLAEVTEALLGWHAVPEGHHG